jgi:hypothetical protein
VTSIGNVSGIPEMWPTCPLGVPNARHRAAWMRFQLGHFTLTQERLGPLAYVEARRFDTTP